MVFVNELYIFVVVEPAPPIIKDLLPIPKGLNISWKSDVTSQQDRYSVEYVRNDTGEMRIRETDQPRILLTNLYPGATYQIKVYAASNDLLSEPHVYYQAVCKLQHLTYKTKTGLVRSLKG